MPAPIGGMVALCVQGGAGRPPVVQKASVSGGFSKVKITPNSDAVTGSLNIFSEAYRIGHGGIMIILDPYLNLYNEKKYDPDLPSDSVFCSIKMFKGCPTKALLSASGDLLQRTIFNFNLTIPPHKSHPIPFELPRRASLRYRLCAYIKRDNRWKKLAEKSMNFKGYYHVPFELNPFVQSKVMETKLGEIVSTFRVPNTAAIMGQKDGLQASLELQGVLEGQVNATLTFLRTTSYATINIYPKNIRTKLILSQNGQAEVHQKNTIFKWIIDVPMMKRISYANESVPEYSVRYYLKYEMFMGENDKAAISGTVEVEIGTSRDPGECNTNQRTSGATNQKNAATRQTDRSPSVLSMISVPFSFTISSSRSGSIRSFETNEGAGTSDATNRSSAGRSTSSRRSFMSLMSMLSLPPEYSQLTSRSASVRSIETPPPQYDELKKE